MPKAIVFAIVLLLWAAQAVRTAQAASLEVYGRLPDIEEVAISPDGTRLAFVKTEAGNRLVEAYSLADHKLIAAAIVGDRKLRDIEWADEDHLMIFTSTTGAAFALSSGLREWGSLQVLDIKTHRLKVIPGDNPVPHVNMMNVVRGRTMVRHVQGHTLLYVPVITLGHFTEPALEQVDLSGNSQRLVSQGDDTTEGWLVDTGGTVAVEQDYDQRSQRWSIKLRREGRMQEVASGIEAIDPPHILGFGPEADTILLQTLEQGEPVWRLMSLKDGSLTEPMAERKTFTAPIEDARVQRMIGGMHVADDAQYVFFDPGMQYRWDKIVSGFPGEHLRLMSHDNDLLRFVVRVEGATHGYVYELVDMQTRQIQPLGDVYAGGIKPYEVRRVTYAAADGLQIPAYLTLPRDRAARNLPLIVLPHGGPEVRDTAEFDWWSQALADQGYAVLQPNYRGSAVTRKFVRAGYGEWGRKMQTDLSDGVRYLVKQGIADPARVCIVGASYGGYAALAGVTLDPGVYRCAVAVAGVSDLSRALARSTQEGALAEQRYWSRFMGVNGSHDPALDAISPIKHIGAINVPVLLIHGKDDTVVPYEQSQIMYDAMRAANKSVELVTLRHEDHWLSRADTRLQMLQTSVAFLREHDPPE